MLTILGIDPGLANTGLTVLEIRKVDVEVKYLETLITEPQHSLPSRFSQICNHVCNLIDEYKPNVVGIEEVYIGQRFRSILNVNAIISMIETIAWHKYLACHKINPQKVKKNIHYVQDATSQQLNSQHETDAITVAILTAIAHHGGSAWYM